jgi:hypothetical protein
VGEVVVEEADGKVLEFLLELAGGEAGHERDDVLEEEESVVEPLGLGVRDGVEHGWESIERNRGAAVDL